MHWSENLILILLILLAYVIVGILDYEDAQYPAARNITFYSSQGAQNGN